MIDYKRLFGGLIILFLVQLVGETYIIPMFWAKMPGYPGLILGYAAIDYFCSFFLNLFYVPAGYRKNAVKSPEFHRVVLTYFMIFFIVSILGIFI